MAARRGQGMAGLAQGGAGRFVPTADGYRNIISLLMLFTISRIHQHFGFLRPFHPAVLLVAAAGLYALMNPRYLATATASKTWSFKMILAMGVMACLSTPFGISMGSSGSFIIYEYSKTILFAYLVLLGIRKSEDLYKFFWAFTAAAGALAWLSIFVFKIQAARGDDFARIQSGYSYDSNDLGFVAVIAMVITLLTLQLSKGRTRTIGIVILCGLGAAIGRTGSRGAFVTLIVAFGALLLLNNSVSMGKKMVLVGTVVLGLLVAAPAGYWEQMQTLLVPSNDYNWTSETGRKEVALRGLGYMASYPVFGLGIENFPRAEGMLGARAEAREFDPSLPGIKWSAAHNSYVQAGAELGVPGFLLFATMVFAPAWKCFRLRARMPGWDTGDPEQRFLYFSSVYLMVAFIAFSIGCFFVSFAYLDPIYVLVAFYGGLMVSFEGRLRRDAQGAGAGLGDGSVPPPVISGPRRYRGGLPPVPQPAPTTPATIHGFTPPA